MKIKKSKIKEIVLEELISQFQSLREAPDVVDAEKEKEKADKKPGDKKDKKQPPKAPEKGKKPEKSADKAPDKGPSPADKGAKDLPVDAEPADNELENDVASGEKEDAEDVTGGKIADELTGKTVQSLTMEPDSKTLPGAQEIVITFNEIQDPLKILVTKTGQVKFYFKGLHNKLSEAEGDGSKAPYKTEPGQVGGHSSIGGPTTQPGERRTKTTKHATSFSMTNDEYLSWIKFPPHLTITNSQGKVLATMRPDQVSRALDKAKFMRGLSKNVGSDVDYFVAPILR